MIFLLAASLTAVYSESSYSGQNTYSQPDRLEAGKSNKDINLDKLDKDA